MINAYREKKKLKLSNRKQEFAPIPATSRVAMAGVMIWAPCMACDISAFTARSPVAGASERTDTACAGIKNADTMDKAQKMA